MACYTGSQSLCNAALGEYRNRGFRLLEDGDHFLHLYYQDGLLDVFSQSRVTISAIRESCRVYLGQIVKRRT
jgi:hypothetical protein